MVGLEPGHRLLPNAQARSLFDITHLLPLATLSKYICSMSELLKHKRDNQFLSWNWAGLRNWSPRLNIT